MPIIIQSQVTDVDSEFLNAFPDQFASAAKKRSNPYIKSTMDYFSNIAYGQYTKNRKTLAPNYNYLKGILRPEDFYLGTDDMDGSPVREFADLILGEESLLPKDVQHYSIMTAPVNGMVGELSSRPDSKKVKAFDDDSKNEQLQFQTDIMQQYIFQSARSKQYTRLAAKGFLEVPDEEEIDAITYEEVKEYMTSYTSMAERWGNRVLEAMKVEFNIKELSEDNFRDLLAVSREFYHIYEDKTKLGFGVESVNPINVWFLTFKDKKYISDPSNRKSGAYAAGTIKIMEISEIIQRFNLTREEVDHLRKSVKELSGPIGRDSNKPNGVSGWDSIKYDTYHPLLLEEKMIDDAYLSSGLEPLSAYSPQNSSFGNKFTVVEAYWEGKIEIGKVTYVDSNGELQVQLVDESYERVPNQVGEVEWTWDNQWYKGYRIGNEVYNLEPFELLTYCPIIGLIHEGKNATEVRSFVDMLKPFQAIYNVCMNQLWRLLEKEVGNVGLISIRHIPRPKDGDDQDALDVWIAEAKAQGFTFIDDSPENMKAASAFNQYKNLDLTRTNEIQSRYNIAAQMKLEAWELAGITRQRLGSTVSASETATATQTALSQSYAQTEPLFVAHDYVLNQLYQGILDACQYIEVTKPLSTLSYVNTAGEDGFIQVTREDLSLRDLKVYITSRPEDQRVFQEIRQLSQAMLQNGATPYDISVLYTTNSVRQMKDIFRTLKEEQQNMMAQNQQLEQQKIAQTDEAIQSQIQADLIKHQSDQEFEALQNQLDRLSKERIAIIQATGFGQGGPSEDINGDGVADALEISRLSMDQGRSRAEMSLKQQDLLLKNQQATQQVQLKLEELKVARENMKNDKDIAKINAQGRAKASSSKSKK